MSQFDLVKRLGIRVIEVDGLRQDVIYVHQYGIALVRSGLGHKARTSPDLPLN